MRATRTVMSGLPDQAGRVFGVGLGTTTLGRSLGCDIPLPNLNFSRLHAELVWEGETLVLIDKSQVHRTLVNGTEVFDRNSLAGGEEIMFADQMVLRLKIESIAVTTAATAATAADSADAGEANDAEAANTDDSDNAEEAEEAEEAAMASPAEVPKSDATLVGSAAASASIEPEMFESASASSGPAPAPSPSSAPPKSSTPATPPVGIPEPPSPHEAPPAATPDSPPPSATEVERSERHSFSFRCNPI